jgi:cytochrome oxidase Cu insertion factor (SCO1/SenC/PrrC family)
MRTPAEPLIPAERDPAKLRRTAFTLIVLMVVSAVGVYLAYMKLAERQASDETPSFKGRIEKNFKVWRQDETEGDLAEMDGEVYVIAPVLFSKPEGWKNTREILKRLSERYAGRSDFHIICLTVDPEGEPPAKLKEYAEELGAKLPQWWLAATREESAHKFLKNILKMETIPHKTDGEWVYDGTLVVIDRDRHIRKGTVRTDKRARMDAPFDFEAAAKWDAEHPTPGDPTRVSRDLENLLHNVIDHVLAPKPVTNQ